jgi:hypothetical protein
MDLYDRIEKTRFLGREFLVWIWWKSDLFDGRMELAEFGPGEVWLDDQLVLEARGGGESVEQSKLRGAAPSTTPEAREALRQGKVPTKAKISIVQQEREFSFVLDGESFALAGVRTPALLQEDEDEKFYERMYLLEETESLLYGLYREFLALRLSPLWNDKVAPAIRDWVRDETIISRNEYDEMVTEVMASFESPALRPAPLAAPPVLEPGDDFDLDDDGEEVDVRGLDEVPDGDETETADEGDRREADGQDVAEADGELDEATSRLPSVPAPPARAEDEAGEEPGLAPSAEAQADDSERPAPETERKESPL